MAGKLLVVSDADIAIRKLGNYAALLNERYVRCDKEGHRNPGKDGTCVYCYRHLEYGTPETDGILKERGKYPEFQPCDAPVLLERARREIQLQESCDWNSGIIKLREELEAESNV